MRKFILSIALAFGMIASVSAQKAGEQSFSVTGSYATNKNSVTLSYDSNSYTEELPGENAYSLGIEYGKFLWNNVRVGVGLTYQSTCESYEDEKVTMAIIAPNITYYLPVAKNLYYTPCIAAGLASAEYDRESLSGYVAGVSLLAFEYRYSKNLAINVNLGTFQYASLDYEEDGAKISIDGKALSLLSDSSVGLSFYF